MRAGICAWNTRQNEAGSQVADTKDRFKPKAGAVIGIRLSSERIHCSMAFGMACQGQAESDSEKMNDEQVEDLRAWIDQQAAPTKRN